MHISSQDLYDFKVYNVEFLIRGIFHLFFMGMKSRQKRGKMGTVDPITRPHIWFQKASPPEMPKSLVAAALLHSSYLLTMEVQNVFPQEKMQTYLCSYLQIFSKFFYSFS